MATARAILNCMRVVDALYEDGLLRPAKPLNLRSGEGVGGIVLRQPDPARWDINRLASRSDEDEALAEAGLGQWTAELDREDRG